MPPGLTEKPTETHGELRHQERGIAAVKLRKAAELACAARVIQSTPPLFSCAGH